MARKRERITALFFAVLFIGSSSALTVAIIADNLSRDDNTSTEATAEQTNENGLAGKKLENFEPVAEVAELQTIDTTPGTGTEAKVGDTISVDYTGAVAATGTIFQSSLDTGEPASFPLQEATANQQGVIKGWVEGIAGMKVGGTRRLIIPTELAYGGNPPAGSNIPANANLVFDVTLHAIGE